MRNRFKENGNSLETLLYSFGVEALVLIALVVWNHSVVHQGGWQDLAVGVGDMCILASALFYSFLRVVVALVKISEVRSASEPNLPRSPHYAYELSLHCVAILALLIGARYLLF
jgi:hypothetical protein